MYPFRYKNRFRPLNLYPIWYSMPHRLVYSIEKQKIFVFRVTFVFNKRLYV